MRYTILYYHVKLFSSGLDESAHADTEDAAIAMARKRLKQARSGNAVISDNENGSALVASVLCDRGRVIAKKARRR